MKSRIEIKIIECQSKREQAEDQTARRIVEEAKRTNLATHLRRNNFESK